MKDINQLVDALMFQIQSGFYEDARIVVETILKYLDVYYNQVEVSEENRAELSRIVDTAERNYYQHLNERNYVAAKDAIYLVEKIKKIYLG